MHIGFRKDFSKKRRVLVEGAWGGVRDKYKGNHPKPTVLYVPQYVANFVSKKSCSI